MQENLSQKSHGDEEASTWSGRNGSGQPSTSRPQSIHTLTTEEWREAYEKDGSVDLWVEEEFNAGSRLVVSFRFEA